MLDLAYAVLLEQVEGDARASQLAHAFAGSDVAVEDSRTRLDELLEEDDRRAGIDPEERELRDALGLR